MKEVILLFVLASFLLTGCKKEDELSKNFGLTEDSGVSSKCFEVPAFGITHKLAPGDKFVFQVIPPFSTEPIPAFYYEQVTDKTITTPNGVKVNINSLGNMGMPPNMYFTFKQGADMTIYFYGVMYPDSSGNFAAMDWITKPKYGFSINYPGVYFVGKKWNSKFTLSNSVTNESTNVDIEYRVVAFEKLTIGIGVLDAFKIEGYDKINEIQESVSWWSPALGINIKKYSYSNRPGYELSSYIFAVGR